MLCAQVATFISVPVFGYITDTLSTGNELVFAYGLRAVTSIVFYLSASPKDGHVTCTLVCMMLAANLEEVVIDSLFSKRLSGDVRAAMKSA